MVQAFIMSLAASLTIAYSHYITGIGNTVRLFIFIGLSKQRSV
jgi:hypothetical protein